MRRNIAAFVTVIMGIVTILAISILVELFGISAASCSPSVANAQDNPCLAQEATISAQEVAILHLEATNVALEDAVATLEANGSSGDSALAEASVPGLPFVDDFSNNNNGWRLGSGATLVQGELRLAGASVRIPIPEVTNFYLEIDTDQQVNWGYQRTSIIFGSDTSFHSVDFYDSSFTIYEYINGEGDVLDRIHIDGYERDQNRIGISHQNGQLEVYLNNELIIISNVSSHGGVLQLSGFRELNPISYDNLVIRASR